MAYIIQQFQSMLILSFNFLSIYRLNKNCYPPTNFFPIFFFFFAILEYSSKVSQLLLSNDLCIYFIIEYLSNNFNVYLLSDNRYVERGHSLFYCCQYCVSRSWRYYAPYISFSIFRNDKYNRISSIAPFVK